MKAKTECVRLAKGRTTSYRRAKASKFTCFTLLNNRLQMSPELILAWEESCRNRKSKK